MLKMQFDAARYMTNMECAICCVTVLHAFFPVRYLMPYVHLNICFIESCASLMCKLASVVLAVGILGGICVAMIHTVEKFLRT